eukprot:gene9136-16798_t
MSKREVLNITPVNIIGKEVIEHDRRGKKFCVNGKSILYLFQAILKMEKQKLLLIFLISNLQFLLSTATDYCVIGAGPSGLQMGYFLERAGRDYVIFERDTSAGQTNKEFNMRHDWNSLISDDESLLLKHYTKEFFPPADKMVEYLRDFATRLNLKAKYGVNIRRVVKHPENDTFTLYDKKTNPYQCKYLIVSTGLWVENNPKNISGIENTVSYSKMSVNADDYEGKSVFIIGRGNSAFETAQHLAGAANYIHMMSRERARFSWETHYVGDLRAVNDGPIDTYQLKSLDGQFEGDIRHMNFNKNKEGKIQVGGSGEPDNSAVREPYDVIIRCMGFKFDFGIFDKPVRPKRADGPRKKYPMIHHNYESTVTKNIFFAGTITHSLDWRKSAGGFIHGFRYTKHTGVPFKRGIVLNLEYGKNFSGPGSDPFKEERAVGEVVDAHLSNFLHPVLYYYSSPVTNLTSEGDLPRPDFLHHILEDFLAMWDALLHHHLPLRWFLEKAVGEDLRHFFAEDCLQIAMISKNLPIYCREHYLKGSMLDRPSETHDQLVLELQAKASEAA